jgi:hypothetical protein
MNLNVGPTEFTFILVVVTFFVTPLVVAVLAAVDAGRHPLWAWQRVGLNRNLWVPLPLILVAACGVGGLCAGSYYFYSVRPRLVAAETGR